MTNKALFGFLLTFSVQGFADPTVTYIDKSLQADGIYTIQGTGFGGGPQIELLDDFEHSGAVANGEIDPNAANMGHWSSNSVYYPAKYDDFAYSGNYAFNGWDNVAKTTRILTKVFDNPIQSVYMSYWVAIPPGYSFPGINPSQGDGPQRLPNDSSWKFNWLIDEDAGGESSNVCAPSYVSGNRIMVAGNDLNIMEDLPKPLQWWSWGNWMRISVWLHADAAKPTEEGFARFSVWSEEFGEQGADQVGPVFDADGRAEKVYQKIQFPGWIRTFDEGDVLDSAKKGIGRPLYDDIYIASGPNAYARIELSDNREYAQSSRFSVQEILSWGDTEIKFKVVASAIPDLPNSRIHIFTADGNRVTDSYPLMGVGPAKMLKLEIK